MHSIPVPINVRCYSNSDIIVRRSEVTLGASKRHGIKQKPRRFFARALRLSEFHSKSMSLTARPPQTYVPT